MRKHYSLFITALVLLLTALASCEEQVQHTNVPEDIKELKNQNSTTELKVPEPDINPVSDTKTSKNAENDMSIEEYDAISEEAEITDYRASDMATSASCYSFSTGAAIPSYKYESESFGITKDELRSEKSSKKTNSNLAKMLTAGEINDFQKWKLWNDISEGELKSYSQKWKLKPQNRYSTLVQTRSGRPIVDCIVELIGTDGKVLWRSRTDNTGKAELWSGFNSNIQETKVESIYITYKEKQYEIKRPKTFEKGLNILKIRTQCDIPTQADILFTVDATGSMGDEIDYLQAELLDIIKKVNLEHSNVQLNIGSVFYRDHGDQYVTRKSQFSKDVKVTNDFIAAQGAGGGGDGPEAVDDALQTSVDEMNWSKTARARIMFLILDAPPHNAKENTDRIIKYTAKAAEKGIRVIPLVASGGGYESDKSLEYLMRSMALATNGTYAFLTNHSGIGNSHTAPSTDKYEVELLNDLMLRLINQYLYAPICQDIEPDEIQELNQDTTTVQVTLKEKKENPQNPLLVVLKAFPNPARETVWAEGSGIITELYFTDNSGKILQRFFPNSTKQQIELFNYPSGLYFIKAKIEDTWITAKVVVAK